MSIFYDEIMTSINETMTTEKGKLRETVFIKPVKKYNAEGVKKVRKSLHMTQAVFAGMIGVSQKTVEAWESGRNTPMGPASRVLDLLESDSAVAERFVINGPLQEKIAAK
ncbi:MAG: helix-turn-helix domain-containing protein [Lachnospiraceae bacterium]|nr:helix-turn-helix domain-containing protein [Lachnospiraceae bacterium]